MENSKQDYLIYNKLKINRQNISDVSLNSDVITPTYRTKHNSDSMYGNKKVVIEALERKDYDLIRNVSNYFYRASGVYQKVCNYLATLYRYDWYVEPRIFNQNVKEDKITSDFMKTLDFLDSSNIKKMCADICLNVIRNGCYYAYDMSTDEEVILQELPAKYCRSIYSVKNVPAVEFNVSFFDDKFGSTEYRNKILKLFPKEIQEGYKQYKLNQLKDETSIVGIKPNNWYKEGWILLDPDKAVKFSLSNGVGGEDVPILYNSIPDIIDLDAAEMLDKKKQAQQLVKILVQKLPTNKNGDLIFDNDEAADIHMNAVEMLKNTVGVDILTTFADIEDIDLSDSSEMSSDAVDNATDAVYRSMGVTENLFNTDGNLSTEKSIAVDEAAMRTLILQMEAFFQKRVDTRNTKNNKKYKFKFHFLNTTIFNYKDLSDKYKSQVSIGFSKVLPQIALGHSQSSILNTAFFENQILNLSAIMIPPLQSSVMNIDTIKALDKNGEVAQDLSKNNTEDSAVGRPEKAEGEKSDKTIANQESMN